MSRFTGLEVSACLLLICNHSEASRYVASATVSTLHLATGNPSPPPVSMVQAWLQPLIHAERSWNPDFSRLLNIWDTPTLT
ncbi:hypothetical protein PT974_11716 [Cladobotryum mycophilum]|uniref:Secreted protein n=1 Tax=Cladobotryum mycophilum TaxID=491253 RepID=A0ABR0S604_9HYPO